MKICDRHYNIDGSSVHATEKVMLSVTGESFDLCHSCAESVREFIISPTANDQPKKRGRKPAVKADGQE